MNDPRHFVPGAAFELTACLFFSSAAPLLEEERDDGRAALLANVRNPFGFHRARAWPGFSTDDDPINLIATHYGLFHPRG